MQANRLQSTDQTAVLVYADVGSTLSRNPNNANISLQLDDDCVQYADLEHHQQTPELHQKECNSHTGTVPCPSSLVSIILKSLLALHISRSLHIA